MHTFRQIIGEEEAGNYSVHAEFDQKDLQEIKEFLDAYLYSIPPKLKITVYKRGKKARSFKFPEAFDKVYLYIDRSSSRSHLRTKTGLFRRIKDLLYVIIDDLIDSITQFWRI